MVVVAGNVQGIGRFSLEEVTEKLKRDFVTCEALLQKSGAYLTGLTPTEADCMLWAFLDVVRRGCS
jgi:glutathione S-transferase